MEDIRNAYKIFRLKSIQTGCEVHPASYANGYRGSDPGGKAAGA
jgi:hypothetical protein